MIKLYKKENGGVRYHEAWDDSEGNVTVHWGEVGTRGETKTVPVRFWQSAEKVIEKELASARADGFCEIDTEDHIGFVVQYQIDGHGSEDDLEKRYAVEDILNESLGWTGNGNCDGGQIGSGSMEIFSYVIDPHVAYKRVIGDFSEYGMLDGALIAYEEDEDYKVLYPENYSGVFKFL
jgi:hypothetical protein